MNNAHRDRGFTLIEVLVSVAIGSLMMAALLQGLFLGLRTLDDANQKIVGSNDTQLIASYFTSDVASAKSVSTTGETKHIAPSVSASSNNYVVSFFAFRTDTTAAAPDDMAEAWDAQSIGPLASGHVSIEMADRALTGSTQTGIHVAESTVGTSSITHTVSLAPTLLATISRRSFSVGSTGGSSCQLTPQTTGTCLTVGRPPNMQAQDLLLAHVAVRGVGLSGITPPSGWTPIVWKSTGSSMTSAVYSHPAGSSEPPGGWKWTFTGAGRDAAIGIADYAGAAAPSANSAQENSEMNPCGGETPAVLLSWSEDSLNASNNVVGIPNEVAYVVTPDASGNILERRRCTNDTGAPVDTQLLAQNLRFSGAVTGDCDPVACESESGQVNVTLTVAEAVATHGTSPRVYQLRGTTRTTH